jgi:hypothetical protein
VKDLLYCLVRFITSKRGARGQNGGEWLHMRNGNEQVSQGRQQEGVGCVEAAGTRSVRTLYYVAASTRSRTRPDGTCM